MTCPAVCKVSQKVSEAGVTCSVEVLASVTWHESQSTVSQAQLMMLLVFCLLFFKSCLCESKWCMNRGELKALLHCEVIAHVIQQVALFMLDTLAWLKTLVQGCPVLSGRGRCVCRVFVLAQHEDNWFYVSRSHWRPWLINRFNQVL